MKAVIDMEAAPKELAPPMGLLHKFWNYLAYFQINTADFGEYVTDQNRNNHNSGGLNESGGDNRGFYTIIFNTSPWVFTLVG